MKCVSIINSERHKILNPLKINLKCCPYSKNILDTNNTPEETTKILCINLNNVYFKLAMRKLVMINVLSQNKNLASGIELFCQLEAHARWRDSSYCVKWLININTNGPDSDTNINSEA